MVKRVCQHGVLWESTSPLLGHASAGTIMVLVPVPEAGGGDDQTLRQNCRLGRCWLSLRPPAGIPALRIGQVPGAAAGHWGPVVPVRGSPEEEQRKPQRLKTEAPSSFPPDTVSWPAPNQSWAGTLVAKGQVETAGRKACRTPGRCQPGPALAVGVWQRSPMMSAGAGACRARWILDRGRDCGASIRRDRSSRCRFRLPQGP